MVLLEGMEQDHAKPNPVNVKVDMNGIPHPKLLRLGADFPAIAFA